MASLEALQRRPEWPPRQPAAQTGHYVEHGEASFEALQSRPQQWPPRQPAARTGLSALQWSLRWPVRAPAEPRSEAQCPSCEAY